jgi:hypothetical protein
MKPELFRKTAAAVVEDQITVFRCLPTAATQTNFSDAEVIDY